MKGRSPIQKAHRSNWKSIIVLGVKEYNLDESGSLIEKFEKKKPRRNLFRINNSKCSSVVPSNADKLPKFNTTEPIDNAPTFSEMNQNMIQDGFLPETDKTIQFNLFEDVECNFHYPNEIDDNPINFFEEFDLDFF